MRLLISLPKSETESIASNVTWEMVVEYVLPVNRMILGLHLASSSQASRHVITLGSSKASL